MKRPRRTKWIKKRAHELTWAALWWSPFAVAALFGLVAAEDIASVGITSVVVGLEVVLIALAIRFWRHEKKQEIDWEFD